MARLNYVELPASSTAAVRDFYAGAFGWQFTDYGPDYAAAEGEMTLGLNGSSDQAIAQALPLIEVDDLEAALDKVRAAGGDITVPIFAYPGGRRFHFRDPSGNELGVYTSEAG